MVSHKKHDTGIKGTLGLISCALKYLRRCACFHVFIYTKMGKKRQRTEHLILQVIIFQILDIQMPETKPVPLSISI